MLTTVEDLQTRKEELRSEMQNQNKEIGSLWHESILPKRTNNKGEFITSIVSKSITVIDVVLLVRKLFKQYGHLFGRSKKKR